MKHHSWVVLVALLVACFGCSTGGSSDDDAVDDAVGDTGPAGGVIFYVDEANVFGWTYLEAAPATSEFSSAAWSNVTTTAVGSGAQGTAVGTGQANTAAIVAQSGHTASAAKLCSDLTVNGYEDWFLPSKDELKTIRDVLYMNHLGGFRTDNYWSSSEYDATQAYLNEFSSAYVNETQYGKSGTQYVRAVRAF